MTGWKVSKTVAVAVCSYVYILMEGETKRQTPSSFICVKWHSRGGDEQQEKILLSLELKYFSWFEASVVDMAPFSNLESGSQHPYKQQFT